MSKVVTQSFNSASNSWVVNLPTDWNVDLTLSGGDAVALDVFVNDGLSGPLFETMLPLNITVTGAKQLTVSFSANHTGKVRVVGS